MRSLVSALLPSGTDPRSYTAEERANIETVLQLRSAPFSQRKNYMHPAMVRHRWGFASLADITGMKDGAGYDARTCSDRVDTIEDLIAKDDRVWAVWTMRGTHTGQLFGIPATGRPIEVLETGIWRLQDGLVAEAWFFGDELRLLRQLGVRPQDRLHPLPGQFQPFPVLYDTRQLKVQQTALSRPFNIPRTPDFQVLFRNFEAIVRLGQDIHPLPGLFAQPGPC